jgi:Zn-dependent protease
MNFPLVRILGTEVRAHWSWILVLAFIGVFFGYDLTTGGANWPAGVSWIAAGVTAVAVFLSVVAHELVHVVVARRNGMPGPVLIVQLLGGPFVAEAQPGSPGREFRLAAAGPAFSLAVMAVCGVAAALVGLGYTDIVRAPVLVQAVQFVLVMTGVFNAFLGAINLLPGYPMDGARILHAIAWAATGHESKATTISISVGRILGILFMVFGALVTLVVDSLMGLALMIAGWMLVASSRMLDRRSLLQSLVVGLRAGDAATTDEPKVPPQLTLDVFATEYLNGEHAGTAALVERGADLVGLIGTAQVRKVPRAKWTTTRTEQAMVPVGDIPVVGAETPLWSAMEILERAGLDAIFVTLADGVRGLMTRRGTATLIHERASDEQRASLVTGRKRGGRLGGR